MNPVPLTSLWLPVLLSAVVVFLASSVVHMLLTYHRTDFGKLPSEAEISDSLRRFNVPPGDYIMPHCSSPAEMKTPEFKEKWQKGPRMIVTARCSLMAKSRIRNSGRRFPRI